MLEPVFGPGLTGLAELDHSSYMASILQILFALPAFQTRYFNVAYCKWHEGEDMLPLPAQCVECQMRKVADGLLSGRYSHPVQDLSEQHKVQRIPSTQFRTGIKLAGLMALIQKQPAGSEIMQGRDAEEFFTYLLDLVRKDGKRLGDRERGLEHRLSLC